MADPAPRNVSAMMLGMALLLGGLITAVVMLGLRSSSATGSAWDGKVAPVVADDPAAPLTQSDTVSPGSKFTGQVYYPIPYSSPPNLKIHSDDKKRVYEIAKEDEFGFIWLIRPA